MKKKRSYMNGPMRCPCCGEEMTPGYLAGRSPLLWTPKIHKKLLIKGKEDVALSFFSVAYLCRDCQKVVIQAENEK